MAQPKSPAGAADTGAMRIDSDLVRELAELLTANELTEIEVADGDRKIRVKRETPALVAAPAIAAAAATVGIPASTADSVLAAVEEIGRRGGNGRVLICWSLYFAGKVLAENS